MYLKAIKDAFASEIDYAILIKVFGGSPTPEKHYSPAVCSGAEKRVKIGNPDKDKISTSYIERSNLTIRMNMRRFTRLTNAFSKKVENLEYAVSLHFMYYNFVRIHQTLRCTPAMQAGVTDHVWEIEDIVRLADSK